MAVGKGRSSGVTLIELTLTLGLLAVVAGMGLSSLQGVLTSTRETRDVRDIQEHLLETRSLARNLARDVTLSVTGSAMVARAGDAAVTSFVLGPTIAQVAIDTPTGTLTFNPRGGTNEPGPVEVVVVTTRRQVHRFRVYPAIGTVRRG